MSRYIRRKAARSGSQDCPICKLRRMLVEHHINGRECDDWDKPWNRAYICPSCHDACHTDNKKGIIIEGWVQTTRGKELAWHRRGEPNECLESCNPHTEGIQAPLYTQKS